MKAGALMTISRDKAEWDLLLTDALEIHFTEVKIKPAT
jgi:hypothetical protein